MWNLRTNANGLHENILERYFNQIWNEKCEILMVKFWSEKKGSSLDSSEAYLLTWVTPEHSEFYINGRILVHSSDIQIGEISGCTDALYSLGGFYCGAIWLENVATAIALTNAYKRTMLKKPLWTCQCIATSSRPLFPVKMAESLMKVCSYMLIHYTDLTLCLMY